MSTDRAWDSAYYREASAHTVQTQPHAYPGATLPSCPEAGCLLPEAHPAPHLRSATEDD